MDAIEPPNLIRRCAADGADHSAAPFCFSQGVHELMRSAIELGAVVSAHILTAAPLISPSTSALLALIDLPLLMHEESLFLAKGSCCILCNNSLHIRFVADLHHQIPRLPSD